MSAIDLTPPSRSDESALPLFREEHAALRDSARSFVDREIRSHIESWERDETFPRQLFRAAGDAGFLGLGFDLEVGGSGPDLLAQAVWIEELARSLSGGVAADIGATSDLAAVLIDRAGTDDQRRALLPPLLRGERLACLAIAEPDASSDGTTRSTRARRTGEGWILDGTKAFVTGAARADDLVVAATDRPADGGTSQDPHDRITLFHVRAEDPGVGRRRSPMMGWRTSCTGEVSFDRVTLGDGRRLGESGSGSAHLRSAATWERLARSLGAVAAAERTLELGIAHARDREAFGRPIATFQVWRHRFADLHTRIRTARALTYRALRLVVARAEGGTGVEEVEVDRAVAMATLLSRRLDFEVADDCLQVHGGAGYMMEYPIQRAWRDARMGAITGGTDQLLRELIGATYGL